MSPRPQYCHNCGESMGIFEHSRLDGPLTCGSLECNRAAREEERAEYEGRAERAQEDGYERY